MAVIGVVGGTGKLGAALAGRWAKAGHEVLIGSRSVESAEATAAELSERFGAKVGAGTNLDVATRAEIVVTAVPWSAQVGVC
jgi:8-hydroxy-5-deazaflavin:NADPH oxidoreductase